MDSARCLEWFALYVRTKHENSIGKHLHDKGYETYVPCQNVERKWADRIKTAPVPLFPNYVFCRFDPSNRFPVVSTPDVYDVVGAGRTPTPIPDEEMSRIQHVIRSGTGVQRSEAVSPGEPVVVVEGPLKGLKGSVVRAKNEWRLVVTLTLLQRGVSTEINRAVVRKVSEKV